MKILDFVWYSLDLNPGPSEWKSNTLPTELLISFKLYLYAFKYLNFQSNSVDRALDFCSEGPGFKSRLYQTKFSLKKNSTLGGFSFRVLKNPYYVSF